MRLLVSVTSKREGLEAVEGGADIIDVKNPNEGSLGANFPRIIRQITEITPRNVQVSATIGDLPNLPGTASLAALGAAVSGTNYVKAGLYGVKETEEASFLMKEVSRAAKDFNSNLKVIAAGYADFRRVGCLSPLKLPEIVRECEVDGVMIDVKIKGREKLFEFLTDNELSQFIEKSHKYGLTVALAGSLDEEDLSRVFSLGADIIGVRRAVCTERDRLKGEIQRDAVAQFTKAISLL